MSVSGAAANLFNMKGGLGGYLPGCRDCYTYFLGKIMKRFIIALLMLCVLGVVTPAVLFAAGSADAVEQTAKVSLNSGSTVELQTLPGIGAVTAERIVTFRKQNGPFATVDDLVKVKGVGIKTLEKLRTMLEL